MRITFLGDIMAKKKLLDLSLCENTYDFSEGLSCLYDFKNSYYIIGNLVVTETKERVMKIFYMINFVAFCILFFLCWMIL